MVADAEGPGSGSRPLNLGLPSVELPGIELGTEMRVTCGNVEVDDAKVRESTRRDLRIRRRC